MELNIKPFHKNTYAKGGILIKNSSPKVWLNEIEKIGFSLNAIKSYPIPSKIANELYGCLIVYNDNLKIKDIGKNAYCQVIENKVFIPENAIIYPAISPKDFENIFDENQYILHPDFGFFELNETVNWNLLILIPEEVKVLIKEPYKTVFIPQQLKSIRIEANLDQAFNAIDNPFSEEEFIEKLPFDMQKILKGNQREMDKFLKFLEQNPEQALKFAVPLDTLGTFRGNNDGSFRFGNKSNIDFLKWLKVLVIINVAIIIIIAVVSICGSLLSSLAFIFIFWLIRYLIKGYNERSFKSTVGNRSSFLLDNSRFNALQNKYENLAKEFTKQKEYHKAANVYLRLLKDNNKAAETLEKAGHYNEAAAIYLKYCKNKSKAAECYEEGKMYLQAIEIYKELPENNFEKIGDLYVKLNQHEEAQEYYIFVIEDYKKKYQFVKASLIFRKKIYDFQSAQDLLFEGWRSKIDAYNCLNNYFANIQDIDVLKSRIIATYNNDVDETNNINFVQVLKNEYSKDDDDLKELIRNIVYEIVAEKIQEEPNVVSELIFFNKTDKQYTKDVMKYKLNRKTKY